MIHELKAHLESSDLPLLADGSESLGRKIQEILWNVVRQEWTEADLEDYIGEKIEATTTNIEQLETQEYPDIASEKHAVLHSAFVAYEEALLSLDHFFWGDPDPNQTLGDVLRLFQSGDLRLSSFLSELEEDLAPLKNFRAVG